jgi:hypothetical protein
MRRSEYIVGVASRDDAGVHHVALVGMDERCIRPDRVLQVNRCRRELVFDRHELYSQLRGLFRFRRHEHHGLADVADDVASEEGLLRENEAIARLREIR